MGRVVAVAVFLSTLLLAAGPVAADLVVGYTLADRPTEASYTPDPAHTRNDGDGPVTVTRTSPGVYQVLFDGVSTSGATSGGNAQVTATSGGPDYCKVQGWSSGLVRVRCFDGAGQPADAPFALLFQASRRGSDAVAYAWGNQPTAASYTPSASYVHNPAGGGASITRSSTGRYRVSFPGLTGAIGGNALVTAYGTGGERCTVASWGVDRVDVQCTDAAGNPADTYFSALLTRPTAASVDRAWAWADRATTASYTPSATYSFNGAGGAVEATRQGAGRYTLSFAGLATAGGNVQATAYASSAHCAIGGWTTSGGALTVPVHCFDPAGAPADSRFALLAFAPAGDDGGGDGGGGTGGSPVVTVFDFEDLPANTRVTTQYADRGLILSPSGWLDDDAAARSGTRVLRSANPNSEFHTGPLTLEFSADQSRVSFHAGGSSSGSQGTLTVYDAAGNQLAQDGPKEISSPGHTTPFSAIADGIRRAVLQYDGSAFESIDDLEIEGAGVGDLPTDAPVVVITSPADFTEVTTRRATFAGTVSGEGVLSPLRVEVEVPRPPGSTAPSTITSSLPLTGSGDVWTFSGDRLLSIGPQTFTARAENSGGLSGEAEVRIAYYPAQLLARMDQERRGRLGRFVFSGSDADCVYAVFERAAVALDDGETFVVRGAILDRWLGDGDPSLGCPTSEERQVEGDIARAQDFTGGRIYAELDATYVVPSLLRQAMDAAGGEALVGVPMEEVRSHLGAIALKTEMFQRFRRAGGDEHLATVELRSTAGDPAPRLYVERRTFYPGTTVLGPNPSTVVHEYPCADLGTCDTAVPPPAYAADIGQYCNYEHYDWEGVKDAVLGIIGVDDIDTDPPEWSPIVGEYVSTPAMGVIQVAEHSTGDNPFTHEESYDPSCSLANLGKEVVECVAWHTGLGEPLCCASDWHIDMEVLPAYRHLIGDGPGSSESYRDANLLVVEWERFHSRAFTAFGADPHVGDVMFAAGRWIVDCGHTYKTEIHPPSVLSFMRGSTYNGKPATFSLVWVNGFYSGDEVRMPIYPPPRPSPTATLAVRKEGGTPLDVTVGETLVDGQYVSVRFTAPERRVEVTPAGEMKWEAGRDYKAKYWVYWTE